MLLAATGDDVAFMERCLLIEAAFPNGTRAPTDALADDHIARYIEGWGRAGDIGLVAWDGDRPVGGSWTRLFPAHRHGYGFLDERTPELTVAVVGEARGRGLGRAMTAGILDLAAAAGHDRVSLSVDDGRNPVAVGLYRSLGFGDVGRDPGGSLTMVSPARPSPPADGEGRLAARPALSTDGPALLRLREVMLDAMGRGGRTEWWGPFLTAWSSGTAAGRLIATVVDGPDRRSVASAIAALHEDPRLPGPEADRGPDALVSSVATDPDWRGRGAATACVEALQAALVEREVRARQWD